jgi:hypothetical protein
MGKDKTMFTTPMMQTEDHMFDDAIWDIDDDLMPEDMFDDDDMVAISLGELDLSGALSI